MRAVDQFSMTDPETAKCPFPYYAAMRKEEPVHLDSGTGFYWVSRYEDVTRLARDTGHLSAAAGLIIRKQFQPRAQALWDAAGMEVIDTFATSDPPEHDDYRAVGMKLFDKHRVEQKIAPRIGARVNALIDEFIARGEIEFVHEFAARLQGEMLCEEFGVPREDMPRFKRWTDAVFEIMTPGLAEDREVELIKVCIEFFRYLDERIKVAADGPAGRVFHALATQNRQDGSSFSSLERVWMAFTAFSGGNDTTLNMLNNGMRKLAVSPELQRELRGNGEKIDQFVEEMLRIDGSVQAVCRVALADFDIAGTRIPKGAKVILAVGSANRDAALWNDPEEFHLDRSEETRHIAFGYGRHVCIGMHLARRELQIAFRILLDRLHDIRLAVPEQQLEQLPMPFFRAIGKLPIRFSATG